MELLRIVAMLLVMVTHSCFLAFGVPSQGDATLNPAYTLTLFGFQSLSCICVNLFVAISGWFGIRINLNKVLKLIGQVLFFSLLIWGVLTWLFPENYFNWDSASTILMLNGVDYWFVKAYIGLMLLSPLINAFLEKCNERQLICFLVSFYTFQTVYGWLSIDGASWMEGGYSAFSFIGLYMLARYLHMYPLRQKGKLLLAVFVAITVGQALLAYLVTRMGIPVAGRLFTYTNPLVIIQTMSLLLLFSRLSFHSRMINWVGSSCLAVYLLHANELVLRPYYGKFVHQLYTENGATGFFAKLVLFLMIVFLTAVLLEKTRLAAVKVFTR